MCSYDSLTESMAVDRSEGSEPEVRVRDASLYSTDMVSTGDDGTHHVLASGLASDHAESVPRRADVATRSCTQDQVLAGARLVEEKKAKSMTTATTARELNERSW